MIENKNKPNPPRKLADEELAAVTGGYGYWDITYETSWFECYQLNLDEGVTTQTFEAWLLRNVYDEEDAKARNAWIADGRPDNVGYYFENGTLSKNKIK